MFLCRRLHIFDHDTMYVSAKGGSVARNVVLPLNGSCSGLCGVLVDLDNSECFCDADCITFDDCCGDYAPLCGNKEKTYLDCEKKYLERVCFKVRLQNIT